MLYVLIVKNIIRHTIIHSIDNAKVALFFILSILSYLYCKPAFERLYYSECG